MPALRQSPRSSSLTSKPVDQSSKHIISRSNDPSNRPRVSPTKSKPSETAQTSDVKLANKKVRQYLPFASQTPFPEFLRPTVTECHDVHDQLSELHQDAVDSELGDGEMPETFPHVLDALIVAIFSQATSWSNAKRAIASVREVYGSTFAYQAIYDQGAAKLEETIRCGGLHVRKTKMIMSVLGEVKERYGDWTFDHLHNASDEDAMEELLGYKYVGVKTASVVMSWSLKRHPFTVDTHVFRITGLWGWRPANASKEDAQAHLEYRIPKDLRANLHFLLIQHGRRCPACRGGAKGARTCPIKVDRVSVVGNAEQ